MKKLVFFVTALVFFGQLSAQEKYYWYNNTRQDLVLDFQRQYITARSQSDIERIQKELSLSGIQYDEFQKVAIDSSYNDTLNKYWTFIYPLEPKEYSNPNIIYSSPAYKLIDGTIIGISHLIYVKLKSKDDISMLENLSKQYGFCILGESNYIPLLYSLSCTNQSSGNGLDIANALYSTHYFEYATPDIIVNDIMDCVSDEYFPDQWALQNTGQYGVAGIDINYCAARQITTGNPDIIVAIIDQGVELNHPDLPNMYGSGFDSETGTSPSIVHGNHGTACAGIIGAATDNGSGIAGIAPNCPIMSISNSLSASPNSRMKRAEGICYAWQNGASVISNSWGSSVHYDVIDDAINSAINMGRNGKGCIVVFAAGNNNSSVSYPASLNGVITVGAISPCGERKNPNSCDGEGWGSCYGEKLDIMAPGVLIPTTDRQGNYGYNPNTHIHPGNGGTIVSQDYGDKDYTIWFNGTSAACPHVAGVVALMLSVNPHLTVDQVSAIIKKTARKVGNYTYAYDNNHPYGEWNMEMGYGLIDAGAAVQMAQSLTTDLFIRDSENDNGITPSNAQIMWDSPDVWIEDANGNICNPHGNTLCYVCVRIWNKSDVSSCGGERLFLNWAKAGCDLRWDYNWNGNNYFDCGNSPVMGEVINTANGIPIPSIAAHQSIVVRIPWFTPIAEDYQNCTQFDADRWHFCLVARIHDGDEILYENSSNADMATFTTHNNNVAWKNISILDAQYNSAVVSFSNPLDYLQRFRLRFNTKPNKAGDIILKHADILINLDDELMDLWKNGGGICIGGKYLGGNRFLVNEPDFSLENIVMPIGRHYTVEAGVRFFTQTTPLCNEFEFDIIEEGEKEIIGGEHYLAIKDPQKRFKAVALEDITVLSGDSTSFTAQTITEDAQYTWFSTTGDTLAIGDLLQTSQNTSRQYILEVVSDADKYKDVDTVTVTVHRAVITALIPNPANNQTVVSYRLASDVTSATVVIANATGQVLYSAPLDVTQAKHAVNLRAIPTGQYAVRIESQGSPLDSKTLIVY